MSKSFLGFGIRRLDAHPGGARTRTNATVIEEDYKVQEEEEEEEEEMELSKNTSKRRGR